MYAGAPIKEYFTPDVIRLSNFIREEIIDLPHPTNYADEVIHSLLSVFKPSGNKGETCKTSDCGSNVAAHPYREDMYEKAGTVDNVPSVSQEENRPSTPSLGEDIDEEAGTVDNVPSVSQEENRPSTQSLDEVQSNQPSTEEMSKEKPPLPVQDGNAAGPPKAMSPEQPEVPSYDPLAAITCHHCAFTTTRRIYFKKHLKEEHSIMSCAEKIRKSFKCSLCSFTTLSKLQLKVHLKKHKHKKKKVVKCEYCPYAAFKSNLAKHMSIHSDRKDAEPDLMERVDPERYQMQTVVEHGKKVNICKLCDFRTPLTISMKVHMKRHFGLLPYKCEICSYGVVTPSQLNAHMRIHNGEKPYKCKQCDYSSTYKANLKTHVRKHTGEQPFACKYCSFQSKWHSSLIKHLEIHEADD